MDSTQIQKSTRLARGGLLRSAAFLAGAGLALALAAQVTEISIKALDPHRKVVQGIWFTFGEVVSRPTGSTGVTTLQIPAIAARGESPDYGRLGDLPW